MNKAIEIVAILLGGLSLFTLCFLGFAALSGVPLKEVPVAGKLFQEEEAPAAAGPEAGPVAAGPAPVRRTDHEVLTSSLGVLGTWSLPSPYSATELRSLTEELKSRLLLLDQREDVLAGREREVDEQFELLAERMKGLEALRGSLEAFEAELDLREQELIQGEKSKAIRDRARWKEIANVIGALPTDEGSQRLLEYTPEDAALLLRSMEAGAAGELINALPRERWQEYLNAYTSAGPAVE